MIKVFQSLAYSSYITFIEFAYFPSVNFLLNFKVGVNSSPLTEKSVLSSYHFCIFNDDRSDILSSSCDNQLLNSSSNCDIPILINSSQISCMEEPILINHFLCCLLIV